MGKRRRKWSLKRMPTRAVRDAVSIEARGMYSLHNGDVLPPDVPEGKYKVGREGDLEFTNK